MALLAALPASAQPASNAPPMALGSLPMFATESEAKRACPRDVVVWADRDTGYFYPRSRPQYGHTPGGAYACFQAARRADYWDINPLSALSNPKAGREFPIDPSLLDWGS
jgi:hypothetical protein